MHTSPTEEIVQLTALDTNRATAVVAQQPMILIDESLKRHGLRLQYFLSWLGYRFDADEQKNAFVEEGAASGFVFVADLSKSIHEITKRRKEKVSNTIQSVIFVISVHSADEHSVYEIPHPIITISPSDDISLLHGVTKSKLGSLAGSFLSSIHSHPHTLILTRHGQSASNLSLRVGGNSALTAAGLRHAYALADFVRKSEWAKEGLEVWSSHLLRARSSAEFLKPFAKVFRATTALNEINSGEFEGMSYSEIESKYPKEFEARQRDKLNYRYPGGESYRDVIERVSPLILDAERSCSPVLILSHQGILRAIYGYFLRKDLLQIPHVEIPTETLVVLTLRDGECSEERIKIRS